MNRQKQISAWWILPIKSPTARKTWFVRRVTVTETLEQVRSARITWTDPRSKNQLTTWTSFSKLASTRARITATLENLTPAWRENLAKRRQQLALKI